MRQSSKALSAVWIFSGKLTADAFDEDVDTISFDHIAWQGGKSKLAYAADSKPAV